MAPRDVTITLKKLTGTLKGYVEVTARDPKGIEEHNDRWRSMKQWGDIKTVGKAIFARQPDGTYYPSIVDVLPSYQRHGIATKMYQRLQKRMKARIVPSTDQTDAGRNFWVGLRAKGSLLGGLLSGVEMKLVPRLTLTDEDVRFRVRYQMYGADRPQRWSEWQDADSFIIEMPATGPQIWLRGATEIEHEVGAIRARAYGLDREGAEIDLLPQTLSYDGTFSQGVADDSEYFDMEFKFSKRAQDAYVVFRDKLLEQGLLR